MSAVEETINNRGVIRPRTKPIGDKFLDFVSSVRLGVTLLCILVILSMIGMLIIQQNVDGFDAYYASLTPAEKLIYGWLGFFDIYYSWYFKILLLVLSLNIILASIDRVPSAWSYISKPKLTATRGWLLNQPQHEIIEEHGTDESDRAEKIRSVFQANGLKATVSGFDDVSYGVGASGAKDFNDVKTTKRFVVFGESGRLNRIG